MISESDAIKIVDQYVLGLEQEIREPLKAAYAETIEKAFGWVFFYNSKDYLETDEFRYILAGNAPFIIYS